MARIRKNVTTSDKNAVAEPRVPNFDEPYSNGNMSPSPVRSSPTPVFFEGPVGVPVKRSSVDQVGEPTATSPNQVPTDAEVKEKHSHEKWHIIWCIFYAIFVRVIFVMISFTFLYFVSCIQDSLIFLILIGLVIFIFIDGIYVVVWRKGQDYFWFSISIFIYVIINCAYIAIMLEFKYNVLDIACETNATNLAHIPSCGNVSITICKLDELMVSIFMISMVFGRFLLPGSRHMSAEIKFEQTLGFMAAAADVVDFANYIQDDSLAAEYTLIKAMVVIFVFNVLQFCFSLKATKKRNMQLKGFRKAVDIFFSTECWALALIAFTQDIPCFIVRAYIWVNLDAPSADLYFFTVRNFLMIFLQAYRAFGIVRKELRKEREVRPAEIERDHS